MAFTGKKPKFETLRLTDQGADSVDTPPTGDVSLVIRSGSAYVKDDSGTETQLLSGTGNVDFAAKISDYTVLDTDSIRTVGMTTGSTSRTVTLPAAASNTHRIITVKKVDSGTGNVTVAGAGSETVDGAASVSLAAQYATVTVQSNGSNWLILDGSPLRSLTQSGGSLSAPAYSFASDPNTGVASAGADALYLACGGSPSMSMTTSVVESHVKHIFPAGTAGSPGMTFNSDSDTGIYQASANSVSVTCGGSAVMGVSSTGVDVTGNVSVSGGFQTASGGVVKMKVFTGSLAASSSTTLTVSGSVIGATGVGTYINGGDNTYVWQPIDNYRATAGNNSPICFLPTSTGSTASPPSAVTAVTINNIESTTGYYRVVVYYT